MRLSFNDRQRTMQSQPRCWSADLIRRARRQKRLTRLNLFASPIGPGNLQKVGGEGAKVPWGSRLAEASETLSLNKSLQRLKRQRDRGCQRARL